MALLTLHDIKLSFGDPPLLDGVGLHLEAGERVCLVGRNGAGKSTLMKLVSGEIESDSGSISKAQGLRTARLEQEVPDSADGSVADVVAAGLGEIGPLLQAYHRALGAVEERAGDESSLAALTRAQQALEAADGWRVEQRVEVVLSKLGLDPTATFSTLSGGRKRRALLARALVAEPDVLLLDEPTNHLDIASITWLEGFLKSYPGTLLFVTHDRAFLQAVATRILELDRGQIHSYPGDYATYLTRREEALAAEQTAAAEFDKVLAKEEAWLRRGVKARRARNEGRVRALKGLRDQRRKRREKIGTAAIEVQEASRSGDIVLECEGLGAAYDGESLFEDFGVTIRRGDRVGILGPNGCGKTTLLSILLGKRDPEQGSVRQGTQLEVAYFDQMRAQLDEDKSVVENVAPGTETVEVGGKQKHVMGYLRDFLFESERARTPVRALSGGERNRLLLAKLFTRPANLLVMDEPTNDLDAETLELLEERLAAFQGTLLLVSHDRAFLDNVVTCCLAFEGNQVREYVGGYTDWLAQKSIQDEAVEAKPTKAVASPAATAAPPAAPPPRRTKLNNKERRRLDKLPARIETLEARQEELQAIMLEPGFYQKPPDVLAAVQADLHAVVAETEAAYADWEDLEARS